MLSPRLPSYLSDVGAGCLASTLLQDVDCPRSPLVAVKTYRNVVLYGSELRIGFDYDGGGGVTVSLTTRVSDATSSEVRPSERVGQIGLRSSDRRTRTVMQCRLAGCRLRSQRGRER